MSQTVQQALQGPCYGLVHLSLAAVAYADDADQNSSNIPAAITSAVAALPAPPNPAGGALSGGWVMDWGPCVDSSDSNVIFICSFRDSGTSTGNPYFFAVVARGTDTSAGLAGDVRQMVQDLGAYTEQQWTSVLDGSYSTDNHKLTLPNPQKVTVPGWIDSKVKISTGTADALILVGNYVSKNQNVAAALASLLKTYPGTPVVVTGHSLGGAMAQVLAAYLAWQVCPNLIANSAAAVPGIIPHPFAPPTIGDYHFASMYNTLFGQGGIFWYNTLDLVPCAWANLLQINQLWQSVDWPNPFNQVYTAPTPIPGSPGTGLSSDDQKWIDALAVTIGLLGGYTTPARTQAMNPGGLPQPACLAEFLDKYAPNASLTAWSSMLMWEHFPPCYGNLVQAVAGVAPYQVPFPLYNGSSSAATA
jgi:hypothetical protein